MAVIVRPEAQAELDSIEKAMVPPLDRASFETALSQIRVCLDDFSTTYPGMPKQFQLSRPINGSNRIPEAYSIQFGRLEAQFVVVGVNPPPGGDIFVVGFDFIR